MLKGKSREIFGDLQMIFLDRSLVYQLHVNGFTFSFIILSSKFKRIKLKISKSLVSCAADLFLLLPSK